MVSRKNPTRLSAEPKNQKDLLKKTPLQNQGAYFLFGLILAFGVLFIIPVLFKPMPPSGELAGLYCSNSSFWIATFIISAFLGAVSLFLRQFHSFGFGIFLGLFISLLVTLLASYLLSSNGSTPHTTQKNSICYYMNN